MSEEVCVPAKDCDHGGVTRIGQSVVFGQLRWYMSTSCLNCGAQEEDGVGFPPEDLRALLLEKGGRWDLIVDDGNRALVAKVIRSSIGLSIRETEATLKNFPLVYQGTKAEAEWIQSKLEAKSVKSMITEGLR